MCETHWLSYAYAFRPVIYHETDEPNMCKFYALHVTPEYIKNTLRKTASKQNSGAMKKRLNSLIVDFQKNEKRLEMFMQACIELGISLWHRMKSIVF
jgi:ABC-type tungstate transport system permease subunit